MNDMWLISSYGWVVSFDVLVVYWKVVMVIDGCCGLWEIVVQLMVCGKGYCWMVIGENLVMENEWIYWLLVSVVEDEYEMNVVVIFDER